MDKQPPFSNVSQEPTELADETLDAVSGGPTEQLFGAYHFLSPETETRSLAEAEKLEANKEGVASSRF